MNKISEIINKYADTKQNANATKNNCISLLDKKYVRGSVFYDDELKKIEQNYENVIQSISGYHGDVKNEFDTIRDNLMKAISKPVPEECIRMVETYKMIGATEPEIDSMMRRYGKQNYLAANMIGSVFGVNVPKVNSIMERLNQMESEIDKYFTDYQYDNGINAITRGIIEQGTEIEHMVSDVNEFVEQYGKE